jgi:hypothetical protein
MVRSIAAPVVSNQVIAGQVFGERDWLMARLNYDNSPNVFTAMRGAHVTPLHVTSVDGFDAWIYTCMLNVDWDGAPTAYGLDRPDIPDQTGLDPWESAKHGGKLDHARRGDNWSLEWVGLLSVTRDEAIRILRQNGLIPQPVGKGPDTLSAESEAILKRFWDNRTKVTTEDKQTHSLEDQPGNGKFPIVQIPEMSTTIKKGYYVSTTAAPADAGKNVWDPHRYLDSSEVPYSVVPALDGVSMGDFGLVIRNAKGNSTPYTCGDSSGAAKGSTKLGECSGAVYIAMGYENEGDFSFIVFPNSRTGRSLKDKAAAVHAVSDRLRKLSSEDADDLANHCASDPASRFQVRAALTRWGAPAGPASIPASRIPVTA